MAFWRMIKEGNDHFEVSRAEPRVDVCEKRYVFDARAPANASTPLTFHPRDKCPTYEVPEAIASGVKAKQASDERAFAEYANKGVTTVAVRTGADGGMHPLFLAKLQSKSVFDFQNVSRDVKAPSGPLPANINPPHTPEPEITTAAYAPASTRAVQPTESTSTLQTIGSWFGIGGSQSAATAAPAVAPGAAKTRPASTQTAAVPSGATSKPASVPAPVSKPKSQADVVQAPTQQAPPQQAPSRAALPQAAPAPAASSPPDQMAGASPPVMPLNSFEGRWSAIR
jgi:hypothetical protein